MSKRYFIGFIDNDDRSQVFAVWSLDTLWTYETACAIAKLNNTINTIGGRKYFAVDTCWKKQVAA